MQEAECTVDMFKGRLIQWTDISLHFTILTHCVIAKVNIILRVSHSI